MKDFMLTKSGDLMFVSDTRKNTAIKVKFLFSDNNPIRAQFFIDECSALKPTPSQIKLSFEIADTKFTQAAKLIEKKEAVKQACVIRVRTPKGELKTRTEIGSMIESVRHDYLYSDQTISTTKTLVETAIADILPYAKVTAEPVAKHYPNGYKQVMIVKIYDEDTIILEHELG